MSLLNTVRVACGQMCSSSNLEVNSRIVKKLIHQAISQNAKVLFLPEASDYISRNANHSMQLANGTHSKFLEAIQGELKDIYSKSTGDEADKGLYVAIGIHEPSNSESTTDELKKVRNNQLWISNKGEILQTYQKIHLFDVNIANGPILKESNSVEAGNSILKPFSVNETSLQKFLVGFAICYDIRFPELGIKLREMGANILTYPSAFTTKTGESHWVALGRARAIDTQCYVIMAAQCGQHDVFADTEEEPTENSPKRISFGQSIIISPWGDILAQCNKYTDDLSLHTDADGDYYEMCVAELDLNSLESIRANMPLTQHRRPDVFS